MTVGIALWHKLLERVVPVGVGLGSSKEKETIAKDLNGIVMLLKVTYKSAGCGHERIRVHL